MTAVEAMERIIEALRVKAVRTVFGAGVAPVLSSSEQLREIEETVRLYILTGPRERREGK